jgi:hypothetical protein
MSSDPRPLDSVDPNVDLGHQEIVRIILELEKYAADFPEGMNIPIEAAEQWLWVQLGYGDQDELEDAIKGNLESLMMRLPQFQIIKEGERTFFKPVVEAKETRPRKLTMMIASSRDLFTVLTRGRETRIEIPEIEFEMAAPESKEVDTIYNYMAGAVFQLGQYIREQSPSDDVFDKIYATMQMLNSMLDVEVPFHIIAHDPCGEVSFRPSEMVKIEYTD